MKTKIRFRLISDSPNCPLCHCEADPFKVDHYLKCRECLGIFLHPQHYLPPEEERARYETHNNDVNDSRYRAFVSPITNSILGGFSPDQQGLDYGAGTGPVITQVLRENGYQIRLFDPFFHPNDENLDLKYDFIVCCEVIEHFHSPDSEFQRLRELLNPGGSLLCMTQLYDASIEFENWYYRRDPTHVFFYQKETCEWIGNRYDFKELLIDQRLIHFSC